MEEELLHTLADQAVDMLLAEMVANDLEVDHTVDDHTEVDVEVDSHVLVVAHGKETSMQPRLSLHGVHTAPVPVLAVVHLMSPAMSSLHWLEFQSGKGAREVMRYPRWRILLASKPAHELKRANQGSVSVLYALGIGGQK